MATTRQAGQTRWAKRWRSLLAFGSFGLGMTVVTGCSTTPTTAQQNYDPLHGVRTPPGSPAPPNPNPATASTPMVQPPPQAFNANGVPAIPTSSGSSNTAQLAGNWQSPLGRPQSLDGTGSGPPFLPGQLTSNPQPSPTPGVPAPNPTPRVEQVPDLQPTTSTPPTVTPIGSWQSPQSNPTAVQTANLTPDYAKQLQDRGVLSQKQESTPAGLHLTCYLSRGPGGGMRILEVTAADYATAAQAMLRELDASR